MPRHRDIASGPHAGVTEPSVGRIRTVIVAGTAVLGVLLAATFVFSQVRTERLIHEQIVLQARAFAHEAIATRAFISLHGGIFVPASRDATVSSYLTRMPGVKARIVDREGNVYVLQSYATLTKQVSAGLGGTDGRTTSFRLTSLDPVDPANAPDSFERAGLRRMSRGASEVTVLERSDGRTRFRLMLPLRVSADCLVCHAYQGYKVGDLRGAVTVDTDVEREMRAVDRGRMLVVAVCSGIAIGLAGALRFVLTRPLARLRRAEADLVRLASVDALTGVANRRIGMATLAVEVARSQRTGDDLSLVMLDLDHFKRVNDALGHAAGDAVLAAAASALMSEARVYDTVARVGGEEFVVLLPGDDLEAALGTAERIRRAVAMATRGVVMGLPDGVTVSAGVSTMEGFSEGSADELLARADAALYRAKAEGRDRVLAG
ncbi:MAG: diguanylate cyclase [Coriobacteriia bacterium]